MSTDALAAVRAYAQAAQNQSQTGGAGAALGPTDGPDFGSLVTNALSNTEATLRNAETLTQQSAVGQADLVEVATAVAAAEVTLETVISLRDQVVQAYQEILRMPI